jgi:glycosyltransferase involved in cell wall biosynthesis
MKETDKGQSSASDPKIKVLHLITCLSAGGAEMMLFKLLSNTDRAKFEPCVVSLMKGGILEPQIKDLGIAVFSLDMDRGKPNIISLVHLNSLFKTIKPDIIQSWMYHCNIAASIVSLLSKDRRKVIWNIRHSLHDFKNEKPLTSFLIRIGALLSFMPQKILYNSTVSRMQHESIGYRSRKGQVIPNGFDCERFKPDNVKYKELRTELDIPSNSLCVGMITRYHPMKDHANFLHAAAQLKLKFQNIKFLLVGSNVSNGNKKIVDLVKLLDLNENIHLLGERQDIPEILAGLDVLVLSSSGGEGFPNIVGEAMACAVPCVVTDVGDSAWIVADIGISVPRQNDKALANGIEQILNHSPEERSMLGMKARHRIMNEFLIETIGKKYENLYKKSILNKNTR